MSSDQCDYELTPEEETRMELEHHLGVIRCPFDDDGYLEALDAAALIASRQSTSGEGV